MMLLADSGIYLVENMNLDPLSAAKAYVVLLIVTPLRIQGASAPRYARSRSRRERRLSAESTPNDVVMISAH